MEELKKKTEKELLKTLKEKRNEVRAFRFDLAGSKTRNVKQGKNLKKDIAHILTELKLRDNVDSQIVR